MQQMLLENKTYKIHKVNKHKIALNGDDGERLIQEDGITMLEDIICIKNFTKIVYGFQTVC